MSKLDEDLAEARRLGYGVWYGRYKADHPGEPAAAKTVVEEVTEADPLDGICDICGKPYRKYNSQQKRCSGECSEVYHRRHASERYRKNAGMNMNVVRCPICGTEFQTHHRAQKYCCKACQRARSAQQKRMKRSQEEQK